MASIIYRFILSGNFFPKVFLLIIFPISMACGSGGKGGDGQSPKPPSAQVVNHSTGTIYQVAVGGVPFQGSSALADGNSTQYFDVPEGSDGITLATPTTAGVVSIGSLGSFQKNNHYAINIKKAGSSYCAELWQLSDTSVRFDLNTQKVLVSSPCSDFNQFDGHYSGTWGLTCFVCGDSAEGTFTATIDNRVFTQFNFVLKSGSHVLKFDSGAVSSTGGIAGTGNPPPGCPASVTAYTGNISIHPAGDVQLNLNATRPDSPGAGCEAETGYVTGSRF